MQMNFIRCIPLFILVIASSTTIAQRIEILNDNKQVSLRGLSVVDDNVVWVSGSKGTVGKSVDGGKHFSWTTVPGYEARDFRDIEAFDKSTAVVIAIAEPANILRTTDGGLTWTLVYENKSKGMFLDAMDFSDNLHGAVVGDVVNKRFFVAHTSDGGKHWRADIKTTAADSTEGCFASSGTNIRIVNKDSYYFVSGGRASRIVSENNAFEIPFDYSKASTGANSLAIRHISNKQPDLWITVGGDFAADTLRTRNCFISKDGGKSWIAPAVAPGGYRSCVEFIADTSVITCGLNGVDISNDEGMTWTGISKESFHACKKAKKGKAIFLSGNNGKIGRLILP